MTTAPDIKGFQGPYRWLSNFFPAKVEYEGIIYSCTECAYQAAKTHDPKIREIFTRVKDPSYAKSLGAKIELTPDWMERREQVMLDVVRAKFRNNPLRDQLDNTGEAFIEETNTWGDTFWGVCDGVGENRLGKILMQVRQENRAIDNIPPDPV